MLIAKALIAPGRGIYEAVDEHVEGDLLTHRAPIRDDSSLEAIRLEAGSLPTVPSDDLTDDECEQLATTHLYAALQAGYDPADPCLHWFRPDMIEEFFPSTEQLLRFESSILKTCGDLMVKRTRALAYEQLCKELGDPSLAERKDWTALPMSYVRDFEAMSTEDDRALMVARLEEAIRQSLDQLDLGKALQGMRHLAQVQSLMFQDTERSQREFALLFNQQSERSNALATPRESPITRKLTAE